MIYAMEPNMLRQRLAAIAKVSRQSVTPTAAAPKPVVVADGITVVPVKGVLADSRSWIDELFGDAPELTYSEMAEAILAAADDPGVSAIMLDIDSPGGAVDGIHKTIEAIDLAKTVKPVNAQVRSLAASAAYWIASRATTIITESHLSRVGSIGVAADIWTPEDVVTIASSNAPNKRPDLKTESGQAAIRKELDDLHAVFAAQVAQGRGVSLQTVNKDFGQGGLLLANQALQVGMIDSIKQVANQKIPLDAKPATKTGRNNMTIDQIKADYPEVAEALLEDGAIAERKRVAALSNWSGINDEVDKIVAEASASGKTYDEVAAQLAAAAAKGKTKLDGDNAPIVATAATERSSGIDPSISEDEVKTFATKIGVDQESIKKYGGASTWQI